MKKAVLLMVLFCVLVPSCDQTANDEGIIGDITRALIVSNYPEANIWMDTTWAALMPGIEFDTWTWPDSVPTRKQLDAYDVVLLYEDGTDSYPDSLGNVMYDYVMNGGNLVLATFYWQDRSTDGSTGWGNLEMIDPLISLSCAYQSDSLGTVIEHPLTRGLVSLNTYYRGGLDSMRSNATAVAWWADGSILMAYNKPNGRIVAVTTYPGEPRLRGGDYTSFYTLFDNALLYAAWGATRTEPIETTKVIPNPALQRRNVNGSGTR